MNKHVWTCHSWSIFVAGLLASVLAGCGGGGSSSVVGGTAPAATSGNNNPAPGALSVSLTDAPACNLDAYNIGVISFDAVNVTVKRVRAHQSAAAAAGDSGWTDIVLNPARKLNLLDLTNGALAALGDTALPAGHYAQLRLVLDTNTPQNVADSVIISGTSNELALDTSGVDPNGIALPVSFDVASGQQTDLVLDFDVCKSVVPNNGSLVLLPAVSLVPAAMNGIEGFVAPGLLGSRVAVSAQANGDIVRATAPDPQTGRFVLSRLPAGTYDVVIAADNHTTAVVAGVPVTAATSVMVSTNGAPIDPPASAVAAINGTVNLNPVSTSAAAFVSGKQSFASGPTVTVKYQPADMGLGVYWLSLPTAAPLLGHFGSGVLPITLAADNAAAGRYLAEATASGYRTQSVNVDISAGDVQESTTLVP